MKRACFSGLNKRKIAFFRIPHSCFATIVSVPLIHTLSSSVSQGMAETPPKQDGSNADSNKDPAPRANISPDGAPVPDQKSSKAETSPREIGGPKGLEPTRYGDWERNGRCSDF